MAMLRYKKYEYQKALQIYEKTILTSLQEVNDALVSAKTARKNLDSSKERYTLEQNKFELADKKFDIGASSAVDLIKAQEALLLSEKSMVSYTVDAIISAINVYKSVGGVDYMQFQEAI